MLNYHRVCVTIHEYERRLKRRLHYGVSNGLIIELFEQKGCVVSRRKSPMVTRVAMSLPIR